MHVFKFYRLATIGYANPLVSRTVQLLGTPPDDDLLIDLSDVSFLDSFGVTYLAACIDNCLTTGRKTLVRKPKSAKAHKYLSDVGLYGAFGLANGTAHFEARRPPADRVDLVHVTALNPGFIDGLLAFLERFQPLKKGLRPSIKMALLELLQNFVYHSQSARGAWIAGQTHRWSKAHVPRMTLCVLDLGRGIPSALRTVEQYARHGDAKLIEMATKRGVSSAGPQRGLGLDVIRRFVQGNRGDLTIIAGNGRVKFRARQATPQRMECTFPGTAAFLSLVPTRRGIFIIGQEEGSPPDSRETV